MEIKVLGAAKEVTGSCYSLSIGSEKILVDCGMFQGEEDLEELNYKDFDFDTKEYSALLLTHAHLDHCGRIPQLVNAGFRGKIYATDATKALAFIVMSDAAKIAIENTIEENRKRVEGNLPEVKPLSTMKDVMKAMNLFVSVKYDEAVNVSGNIIAKFYDAGHILGSSSIQVTVTENDKEKVIVFSGDLGQEHSILVKHTEPITEADYVFMESTYGDRLHGTVEEKKSELIRVITETFNKGGKTMIPVFAIERTQELLYYIGQFMKEGKIPQMPVFLDSPMAIKATDVFKKFTGHFNSEVKSRMEKSEGVFDFKGLKLTKSREESLEVNSIKSPCIILAGSGMCTAGRIIHHIANNIEEENNTLLFVGFQVNGTLGNKIKGGEKKIILMGKELKVKSKIEAIEGFSAHADKDDLYKWLNNFSTKPKVFIIHGDEEQQIPLKENLEKEGFKVHIPGLGEVLEL
ncbi:MBL fold metallo-hydrolase [archaeon]|nr:MBL fold metallo-hydrolase [archaeon]